MNPLYSILIADDHPFFSEGLKNALSPYPEFKIVDTVQNGNEVLSSLEKHKPDILILDINLPGCSGLELIPVAKKKFPQVKIMVLSMYLPSDLQIRIEKEPIDAYVVKNSGTDILLEALNCIKNGTIYYDPNIKSISNHNSDSFSRKLKLSTREKEILHLLQMGLSNKEIGEKLFLSDLTIKTHRKNIMAKMDARNIADLIRKSQ